MMMNKQMHIVNEYHIIYIERYEFIISTHQMNTCHVGIDQILSILKLVYSTFSKWWHRCEENMQLSENK